MSPLVLLLGSLAFSLAFNVAWAWGTTPLSVIAAAACTLIVPAALHLWPQIPANTWLVRAVRALVMTGICAAAAITSFLHAVDVLLANHWSPLAAWSVTGGAELLTTLSTMALGSQSPTRAQSRPAQKPRPRRDDSPSSSPVVAASTSKDRQQEPQLHEVGKPPSMSAQVRAWIAAELDAGRTVTGADADRHFGLTGGARCGDRALKKVLEARERQAG